MVRWAAALVAGVAALAWLAGPAEAFDGRTCDSIYGVGNVERVLQFKIDTGFVGKVDFGDHLHLFGAPQGTAVVCFQEARGVAVVGRAFGDSSEDIAVKVEITYFRNNTVVSAVTSDSNSLHMPYNMFVRHILPGQFSKVRIRLFNGTQVVHTKTVTRF